MKLKTHAKFIEMVMDDLLPSEMDVMAIEMPSFIQAEVMAARKSNESKEKCRTRITRMWKRNPKKFLVAWRTHIHKSEDE